MTAKNKCNECDESETLANKEATTMITTNKSGGNELQFEEFPERADIKVSKTLTTPKGDKIRAIVTTGRSIMLTGIGKHDGDIVTVIGNPEVVPTELLGEIWDGIKSVVGAIIKVISQGCTPTQTTTVNVGPDGKVTGITTTNTCVPN